MLLELNYKTFGQGPAFIILHGLMGQLDNWQTIAKKIASDYTVYLVDQRNHGRSPHTDSHSYFDMAEDLNDFMDQQGIHSATILGHSMGGKTAMQFAQTYEDRVDRLIVIDIGPKEYPPHHNEIFAAFTSLDLSTLASRKEAEEKLTSQIPDAGVVLFLMKNLSRKGTSFSWKMNLEVLNRDYNNIVVPTYPTWPVEVETLFIRGEQSNYILDEDWDTILESFPNAVLETVANAGHWVQAQQPEQTLGLIMRE